MVHPRWITGLILAGVLAAAGQASAQVTPTSVTLTWTAPGDDSLIGNATRYDIRYSTAAITPANFSSATAVGSPPAPVAPGNSQSFVVSGLLSATTYWFAIQTQDDAGNWSGLSNVISKATLAAPDVTRPAPVALNVSGVTDTSATLSFSAVGDDSLSGTATSYDIRYSTAAITTANWATATQASGEPAPQTPGSLQTYTVRGLARQRQYYFAIKVSDDAGNLSALSNVPSGTTTDTLAPSAIRDLTAPFVWLGWPSASPAARERVR
jgi:chitodextrinase